MVAADTDLNVRPEIREIQRKHHVSTLDGPVTPEDIYNTCRDTAFNIIHFASHSNERGVLLSGGVVFTPEEIAQVARLHETECVIFNSCLSSRPAAYTIRHGVRYAIYSNIELLDTQAWKLMVGFYDSLQNGAKGNVLVAFDKNDNGDGDYGINIDIRYVMSLQSSVAMIATQTQKPFTREEMLRYATALLLACGLLTTLIIVLALFWGGK